MEQTIVINRQPEIKNMVSASRYIFLTMPFLKIVCGMAIFIFVVNLIGRNATENNVLAPSDWLGYLSFVLIWAFILFMMDRAIRKSITNNPKNLEPQILTFSQNGLATEGHTYKVEYAWPNIIKIKEPNAGSSLTSARIRLCLSKKRICQTTNTTNSKNYWLP